MRRRTFFRAFNKKMAISIYYFLNPTLIFIVIRSRTDIKWSFYIDFYGVTKIQKWFHFYFFFFSKLRLSHFRFIAENHNKSSEWRIVGSSLIFFWILPWKHLKSVTEISVNCSKWSQIYGKLSKLILNLIRIKSKKDSFK